MLFLPSLLLSQRITFLPEKQIQQFTIALRNLGKDSGPASGASGAGARSTLSIAESMVVRCIVALSPPCDSTVWMSNIGAYAVKSEAEREKLKQPKQQQDQELLSALFQAHNKDDVTKLRDQEHLFIIINRVSERRRGRERVR